MDHKLKLLVQDVKKAISKAPEEKEDGDESERKEGFGVVEPGHGLGVVHIYKVKEGEAWSA